MKDWPGGATATQTVTLREPREERPKKNSKKTTTPPPIIGKVAKERRRVSRVNWVE